MDKPQPITFATVSLVITIVGGWLWATTYFMTRADADVAHTAAEDSIRTTYLELKIDQHNTELAFIEQGGVADTEKRQYDLLNFSVQRMTQQLMDISQ